MSEPATLTVGVIVPVYNRSEVLTRTLASLQAQDHPSHSLTVVVVDDGSEEDIESVVSRWDPSLNKVYMRQEHRGFGAARARNLGASSLNTDVLVFLDSDGIVAGDFISRHAAWHRTNSDAVVIGGRLHVKAGDYPIDALASGTTMLRPAEAEHRDDFRAVLSRRTSGYERTDLGYRAFVSSNVSMTTDLFREVGGFDERFRWWGSEDTELGWRLWQAGAHFIDDPENHIYHQMDADTSGGAEGRQQARDLNRGLLVSLVPQGFYRKGMPDPLPEVPKISVIAHDVPLGAPEEIWKALNTQTLPDFEVIFVTRAEEHDPFAGAAEGDPRCRFVPDPEDALWASRGEYLLFLNAHSAPSPTLLQNLRKRLDQRPGAQALSFGIEIEGEGPYGRVEDTRQVAGGWATELPLALAVRRRYLAKRLRQGEDLAEAIADLEIEPTLHTRQTLIAMPAVGRVERPGVFVYGKSPAKQLWEEAQLGPGQAVKAALRMTKQRLRPAHRTPTAGPKVAESEIPGVRYVGWVGKDNLGDEAMLEATRQLLPWGEIEARGEARDLLLLGGGTLINRSHYLGWLTERDSPRIERAVLGTGVASPDFWGLTEDSDQWLRWLGTCAYVGVRGPHSAETLNDWGFRGEIEVCGDPALALPSPEVEVASNRILIAPASTSGELWGESDDDVFAALVGAAARWIDEGRDIVLMSSHPSDDRPILQMREGLGDAPSTYHAGYLDVDESYRLIASSSIVIGERLHACVLAAAAGRPFVGIEYRPKVRDFAASVEMGEHVLRTDEITDGGLHEMAAHLAGTIPSAMNEAVKRCRRRLEGAGRTIESAIRS